jgi:uncharacterized protein YjlB
MIAEDAKKLVEQATGWQRPRPADLTLRVRKPHARLFVDDGQTPNNPHFPFLHYRTPVVLDPAFDPAAIFEVLFSAHGWRESWRDGIYDFLHFHTHRHEVLGIARGHAEVQFGGREGKLISLKAGDVVVLPAGTGHRRRAKSRDLLVVGAYPKGGQYDEPRPDQVTHAEAVRAIARVGVPAADPVYGKSGPLRSLWR